MTEPYSRAELDRIKEKVVQEQASGQSGFILPDRGQYCPRCGCHLPEFVELSKEVESKLRKRLASGTPIDVIEKEFQDITGCPERWFKIWLIHPDGPQTPKPPLYPPKPCPECGKPLRTAQAQQCFHCGADWHGKSSL
jgi:hypothetical protein